MFGPLDNNTYFCPFTYGFLERNHIISVGQLTIPNLHKNTSYTESLQPLLFALQDLVSRCSGILAHGTAVPKRHLRNTQKINRCLFVTYCLIQKCNDPNYRIVTFFHSRSGKSGFFISDPSAGRRRNRRGRKIC